MNQLKENFPFHSFRDGQEEILAQVMSGKSLLALMPTGMGKSLCFQFPAKILKSELVLVISPLIALMEEQATKAQNFGIDSTFINSTLSRSERDRRYEQIRRGRFQLIFVTPERLRKTEFLEVILMRKICLLAVDEAHCVSQWGHDFRPDYTKIGEFRLKIGLPPVLALTATATPSVQQDICSQLMIDPNQILNKGLIRSNLSIFVHDVFGFDEKMKKLISILNDKYRGSLRPGSIIIYVSLISTLKKLSHELARHKIHHFVYHGDLNGAERRLQQKKFIEHQDSIMVATPAFGMGIDKDNVYSVVHFEPPGCLESYFQEIGRAGRDGVLSNCHFLYDEEDISIQMEFIKWSHPDEEFIRKTYLLIKDHPMILQQQGFDFLREQLIFKNRRDFRPEAAVKILERWGCLEKTESSFPYFPIREPEKEDFELENGAEILKQQNIKLLALVQWLNQDQECRMTKIYHYFTGRIFDSCGKCDICQKLKI